MLSLALWSLFLGSAFGRGPRAIEPVPHVVAAPAPPALAALNTAGFAVLPAQAWINPHDEQRLISWSGPLMRRGDNDSAHLVEGDRWVAGKHPDFLPRLTARMTAWLKRTLPGEDFELDSVQLRPVFDGVATSAHVHPDGGYLTLTHSLIGPGTIVHDDSKKRRIKTVQASERQTTVITARDREALTEIPSTLHAAPGGVIGRRLLLLVRYRAAGGVPVDPAFSEKLKRRLARVMKALSQR